jgi:hypothetical protein
MRPPRPTGKSFGDMERYERHRDAWASEHYPDHHPADVANRAWLLEHRLGRDPDDG